MTLNVAPSLNCFGYYNFFCVCEDLSLIIILENYISQITSKGIVGKKAEQSNKHLVV